ncbi:LOW QUALITY PROTEIN: trypsin epsilon [Drosophila tropicalis]|uniref:LOW QUALITY PROTEIN: trypsin epsilon n=1 Tax=Drosophila tropicalis TaxID=46794 RepID=UPI0035AB865B
MHISYTFLLMQLGVLITFAMSIIKKTENYHRIDYYNHAHKSEHHIDYNREHLKEYGRSLTHKNVTSESLLHKSYYVNILYKGSVMCAGILISQRMIVTSARCFISSTYDPTLEYKAKDMSVLTEIHFNINKCHPQKVIAFYMPGYETNFKPHNIALIALTTKLRRSHYRPIKIFRGVPKVGDPVQMAFFDPTEYGISLYDTRLVHLERCRSSLFQYEHTGALVDPEFYCVKNRENLKLYICSTRPGDPLIIGSELAGINLYGEHCKNDENTSPMDVYYAISHSIKFIQAATDLLRIFTKQQ